MKTYRNILPDSVRQQDGGTLIMAMMIMALLSIIGISVTNTAVTELQITTNIQAQNLAFYDADAGIEYTLARIKADLAAGYNILSIDPANYTVPSGFSFQISVPGVSPHDSTVANWGAGGPFFFISTGTGLHDAESRILASFNIITELHKAFGVGIVTQGDLEIKGAPDIVGSMHANGRVRQMGEGIVDGNVSAQGTVTVHSAVTGTVTPGADEIEVPLITSSDFDYWRSLAQTGDNTYYNGSTNFTDSGNLGTRIIFVDGDVTVSGGIINGTIVATGNITVDGSSSLDGTKAGTAMIAGGNITMNGSSDSYGAFWSNGKFIQNGSSFLYGAIVSQGDIERNGAFNFRYYENIDNENLPKEPPRPVNTNRAEMRLI